MSRFPFIYRRKIQGILTQGLSFVYKLNKLEWILDMSSFWINYSLIFPTKTQFMYLLVCIVCKLNLKFHFENQILDSWSPTDFDKQHLKLLPSKCDFQMQFWIPKVVLWTVCCLLPCQIPMCRIGSFNKVKCRLQ